jgi:Bacterial SH3 domain
MPAPSRWGASHAGLVLLALCVLPLSACLGGSEAERPATSPVPSTGAPATPTASPAPPTPTPPPWPVAPVLPERARARITTDNLNVRVSPTTNAPVIGLLQPGDDVAIAGRSSDSQWLAVVNTGWIAHRAQWMQLTVDLRTLPEVGPRQIVPPDHPPGTSSGYPAVDIVIEAALAQDIRRLVAFAEPLSTACSNTSGLGGPPPCSLRPGAAPGTLLEVFPTAVCEAEYQLKENLPAFFARLYESGPAKNAPLQLYAVVQAPRQQSAFFPEGRWVAILALPDGTGRALGITEKGLVRVDLGCQAQAEDLLQRRPFELPVYVLPPLLTPPVHSLP